MNAHLHSSNRQAKADAARSQRRTRAFWWAMVVALPFAVAFRPYTAVLVIVGMVPALVAWITSPAAQRYSALCIGYLSLAGVLPVAWNFLEAGPSAIQIGQYLSNPFVWLAMYSPAAIGWLVYFVVPQIHEMVFIHGLDRRRRRLSRRQQKLIEEWGPQVDPAHGLDQPEQVAAPGSGVS